MTTELVKNVLPTIEAYTTDSVKSIHNMDQSQLNTLYHINFKPVSEFC